MASVWGISEADSYLPTRGNRSSVRNAVAQAEDKLVLSSALESLPTHVPVRKRVSCVVGCSGCRLRGRDRAMRPRRSRRRTLHDG